MFKGIFASSLHKRLFKLTDNFGWLRKFAEGEGESETKLVVNLPTVGEFLASLAVEGNVDTTSEDDEKQAKLNHAVSQALDAFYKNNLDLSQTAFTSWKFADVSASLAKGLSFFDAEDIAEVKTSALKLAEDAEIKELLENDEKLADAIKYVLTRAYLHSYTIMVAQNPAVAVLNLMQAINDQDIPLSLNVGQKTNGKIVATAAKKKKDPDAEDGDEDSEKEAKFKIDTPRGPRLSDWIRSLRISRAQTLTSLQRELEKKQPRDTAISTYKVQYLILSSHIAHLENIASAWKDLVKNDEYKASRLGSVFIMDDPPIGNLLKQEPTSISALSGFLPPSIYETFGLNSSKIFVKKWDGTLFSSLTKDEEDDEIGAGLEPAFAELSKLMQDTIANLPDTPALRLLKQKLIKYNTTSKTMMGSIVNLMNTADDKKSRAQLFKLMREFKDDVQAIGIILVDLHNIHGYNIDPDKVLQLSKTISDALPRGRENALNFIPSAAFIKQVYLPSVTTKPSFHNDMYAEAVKDVKEALEFGASSIPSFSPAQRAAIVSAMGLTIAQAEALAREIYREGFARILAIFSAIPEASLKSMDEAAVSKITGMYNSSLNSLRSDLYAKLSAKMPKTTTPELFAEITASIWSQLPKIGGASAQTDLSNVIKQIGGSAIVARTEGGSAQDFNDVYSKAFIKRQKPESDSLQGSALHAVERLTDDYFYKFYDEHVKKHDAWKDNYSSLDAGEEAQEVRRGLIRTHYDKILKSNVLEQLGFKMPRGGNVVNHQNPVNPKKDEVRQQYLANVQKFLNQYKTLDSLYAKIDALDADVSMESVLVYIGVELIEAFEPELILHLANSYPKVVIKGVETGFGYAEKGAEDESAGMYGSNIVGTLTYRDLNSNIPSIEYARSFIDKFKQELKFNSRAIGQLHPYTPGGMIADIYYMEERISKLPNENAKTRRAADINRFRTDPLSLLGYMKKRLFDSYGKAIYDRNNDQLNRVLVNAAKNSDKPDVAKNMKQFMEKVGAFADPEWSIKNAGSKANYRYHEGIGDSASVHLQRAFNRVGQISALANNYDTIFVVYKSYFDNRKEELLRTKDKEGRSIWKDYIIPFDLSREEETNRPFTGRLQELAEMAATALVDKSKPTTETSSVEQDEPAAGDIPIEDTDTVALLITDRKSAMDAIGSLKTSLISDVDKSLIKGIVSNLGRKDPKVYANSAMFMKLLVEAIRKEGSIGNREEVASYFESYVSIVAEQAQVVAPAIKAIQAQEEVSGSSDMMSLKLQGEGLIRTNIPTGYSNMEYLKQKLQYTVDTVDYWLQDYQDASLKYNLDDYPSIIKAVVGTAGKNFDQFKAEFDKLTDNQKKMYNIATFGSYVAYYRLYVEAKPIIEAEEAYPDFTEFLEVQDEYLQNFPQLGEKLQEYVNEYKNVSLAMFKEATDLVVMKPKVESVKNSFAQKLTELEKVIALEPASAAAKQAAEKWKADMQDAIQRHKKELGTAELGDKDIPLSEKTVDTEEPLEVSEEDLQEIEPEEVKEDVVEEVAPAVTDQLEGVKAIAENLASMISDKEIQSWLDKNAAAQKNEINGNISNLADALSKLTEASFTSIDKLPRFEQSIGEVVSKVRGNPALLPQIFSDKYMKRLVEIASKTLGVNLSEMPLTVPPPAVEPMVAPRINMEQYKAALAALVDKVRAVEGNVNDMSASQDMLEQLTGNSISADQAAAVVTNTKALLDYLSSLTENDFTDQAGIDNLVKQVILPLTNRNDQDFIKFFSADKFAKLFDAVKSKFGITKQASQKISNTSSIHKVAVYNISASDDADDGYYF